MSKQPPALLQQKSRSGSVGSSVSLSDSISGLFSFGPISPKKIIDFTRGLAVMLKAGLSLVNALDTSIQQTDDSKFEAVLKKVKKDIESGLSLGDSLAKHSSVFNSFYVHLVEAGETAGVLDQVLERLADHLAKKYELRQKVKMAMAYPAMVLSVAVLAMLFLLLVIVPTFAEMYRDFNAALPELTQWVLGVSQWLSSNFFLIAILSGAAAFGLSYLLKKEKARYVLDDLKLKIPVFNSFYKQTIITRFCQTLGTLLQSGITLVDSLAITLKTSQNLKVRDTIQDILYAVKKGRSFGGALNKSNIFPPVVLQMITVGEETAELDEMLVHVATHFREELDLKVDTLVSIIEPALILVLGLTLGFLIVAMYLPMFELMNVMG